MQPDMFGVVFASCCAEMMQKAVLHPVDTMKSKLQYERGRTSESLRSPILSDAAASARIIRTGPRSLYAGITPAIVGSMPTAAVYMPTYQLSKQALNDLRLGGLPISPLAGILTGLVTAIVRSPTSVVKYQLQLKLYDSTREAVESTYRRAGLLGFFAGLRATVYLDVFYAVVQFTVLEYMRAAGSWVNAGAELTHFQNIVIGFLTGTITSICTEPFDVIRTRLIAQRKGTTGPAKGTAFGYKGVLHGLISASKSAGVFSLWKGLLPRLLLKSVGSSIWYAVYKACGGA